MSRSATLLLRAPAYAAQTSASSVICRAGGCRWRPGCRPPRGNYHRARLAGRPPRAPRLHLRGSVGGSAYETDTTLADDRRSLDGGWEELREEAACCRLSSGPPRPARRSAPVVARREPPAPRRTARTRTN